MTDLIANKKIAYFNGCFANYYYPEVGDAMMAIMRKNGVEVKLPSQVCCGLPLMAKGNLKDARANMTHNARELSRLVSAGYAVVVTCSSCGLFLKRDSPHFLQSDEAKAVSGNLYHVTEYLLKLHDIGQLNTEFARVQQTVFYHTPCHLRAQNLGAATAKALELIPGTVVKKISETCCGMSGAYGYEKKNYELSKDIAQKLYREIKENPTDRIVADCGGCRLQIQAGTDTPVDHPLIVLREAWGA